MKSPRKLLIEVHRNRTIPLPSYIGMMHRHLEKEHTIGEPDGMLECFTPPVDLLGVVIPKPLMEDVVEVRLGYRRKDVLVVEKSASIVDTLPSPYGWSHNDLLL